MKDGKKFMRNPTRVQNRIELKIYVRNAKTYIKINNEIDTNLNLFSSKRCLNEHEDIYRKIEFLKFQILIRHIRNVRSNFLFMHENFVSRVHNSLRL